jgi:GNAT superfamily N-acetyltransferase
MSLSAEAVIAASSAMTWIPDTAITEETDEYLLVRLPDYFDPPLRLLRFSPAGPVAPALAAVLDRARRFGLPELEWSVRLASPPEVAGLLEARDAKITETLDVLALDLAHGAPALPPTAQDVTVRWAADEPTIGDASQVTVTVFGGPLPPPERLAEMAKRDGAAIPAGRGGQVVAYAGPIPVGTGGVIMASGVARLWGGAVLQSARGQGIYRAILGARLEYGAVHGATMGLVNARVETSGPILRRAGFTSYGQELRYRIPLLLTDPVVHGSTERATDTIRPHGGRRIMSLSAEKVVAASNAWSWIPDNATTEATEEYLLVRFPDYFEHPLELLRFSPAAASGISPAAVETVLDKARRFGLPDLYWWVRLDSPPEVADLLVARGATVDETLDVLAVDLSRGAPELLPPTRPVTLRWATDISTLRDGTQVGVTVFGGSMPPEDRLEEEAKRDSATVAAGDGGMVVAYSGGEPVGAGGISMADCVARLWGGAVRQEARRQGVYRVILAARLRYGAAHGATMALVKGRIETSAPILRQAGFAAYGQEIMYRVPLA